MSELVSRGLVSRGLVTRVQGVMVKAALTAASSWGRLDTGVLAWCPAVLRSVPAGPTAALTVLRAVEAAIAEGPCAVHDRRWPHGESPGRTMYWRHPAPIPRAGAKGRRVLDGVARSLINLLQKIHQMMHIRVFHFTPHGCEQLLPLVFCCVNMKVTL